MSSPDKYEMAVLRFVNGEFRPANLPDSAVAIGNWMESLEREGLIELTPMTERTDEQPGGMRLTEAGKAKLAS